MKVLYHVKMQFSMISNISVFFFTSSKFMVPIPGTFGKPNIWCYFVVYGILYLTIKMFLRVFLLFFINSVSLFLNLQNHLLNSYKPMDQSSIIVTALAGINRGRKACVQSVIPNSSRTLPSKQTITRSTPVHILLNENSRLLSPFTIE